jgi:hypothetical protein
VASALFAEGDEVVVRERAASVNHLGWGNMDSRHYPLLPNGSVFLLPRAFPDVEAAIEGAKPPLSQREQQDVRHQLTFGRRHGFIVGLRSEAADNPPLTHYPADLAEGEGHRVGFMVAPVLGAAGEVVLAISLQGLPEAMTRDQVLATGERLKQTCQRVTDFITGKRSDAAG